MPGGREIDESEDGPEEESIEPATEEGEDDDTDGTIRGSGDSRSPVGSGDSR